MFTRHRLYEMAMLFVAPPHEAQDKVHLQGLGSMMLQAGCIPGSDDPLHRHGFLLMICKKNIKAAMQESRIFRSLHELCLGHETMSILTGKIQW